MRDQAIGASRETAIRVIGAARDARTVLIDGPSGAGKSTLVRALTAQLFEAGVQVVVAPDPASLAEARDRSLVDWVSGTTPQRLGTLARAGLADATLLPRTAADLSAGERARLSIAIAMDAATHAFQRQSGAWVICDEFASVLDRATAQAVAHTVTRWARAAGVRVVAASAHEDLAGFFDADVRAAVRPGGRVVVERGPAVMRPVVRYEAGSVQDYDALSMHHYRGGRPATRALIRRAVRTLPNGTERVAGVLVVSMPTLNGAWRDLAWPGRYTASDKRARACRINAELRCLSRVIVEPGSRGLGIARQLVRSYLDTPMTPATEAVAQMGAFCPFFEKAGMHAYPQAIRPNDARLADALYAAGVDLTGGVSPECAAELACDPFVSREVDRWARERKAVRGLAGLSAEDRLRAAASLASTPAVAYAHATGGGKLDAA